MDQSYTVATAESIDRDVIRQYARYLRMQARYLEQDGDHREAVRLRARARSACSESAHLS